ncbi:MAG: hypothetical protein ACRC2T_20040 [Thermoguttaceae bacterium]
MDAKITRRLALGTIIGGLAAGPFVMHAIRKSGRDIVDEVNYGRLDINEKNIATDLSPEEARRAINMLFEERKKWIALQKWSANIEPMKFSTDTGNISARIDVKLKKNPMFYVKYHCFMWIVWIHIQNSYGGAISSIQMMRKNQFFMVLTKQDLSRIIYLLFFRRC